MCQQSSQADAAGCSGLPKAHSVSSTAPQLPDNINARQLSLKNILSFFFLFFFLQNYTGACSAVCFVLLLANFHPKKNPPVALSRKIILNDNTVCNQQHKSLLKKINSRQMGLFIFQAIPCCVSSGSVTSLLPCGGRQKEQRPRRAQRTR